MTQIFWDYLNHPESKFDGDAGVLQRKHLKIINIVYIGKESNDLEESEVLGIDDETYLQYHDHNIPIQKILDLKPKEARKFNIEKTQLQRIKKSLKSGIYNFRRKTFEKIMKIV